MNFKDNKDTTDSGILIPETQIINRCENLINSNNKDPDYILSEYKILFTQFKKLVNRTNKLFRMGDNTQKKLIEMNELVHEKVKELKKAEEKLKQQVLTDPLTELLNRRGTYKWLEAQEIQFRRNSKSFCIFLIDIDFFKKVNDTYGHNAGDYVLKEMAIIMKESVREQDCLGRWGGEEFILILPDTDIKGSLILSDKLRILIEQNKMFFDGNEINITISLGGCCYNGDLKMSQCLEYADRALYRSKTGGRNKVEIHEY